MEGGIGWDVGVERPGLAVVWYPKYQASKIRQGTTLLRVTDGEW